MIELKSPKSRLERARFDLSRAQTASYYAHKDLLQHPGSPDVRTAYQESLRRCEKCLEALIEADADARASQLGAPINRAGSEK